MQAGLEPFSAREIGSRFAECEGGTMPKFSISAPLEGWVHVAEFQRWLPHISTPRPNTRLECRLDQRWTVVDSASVRAVRRGKKLDRTQPIAARRAPSITSLPTRAASPRRVSRRQLQLQQSERDFSVGICRYRDASLLTLPHALPMSVLPCAMAWFLQVSARC
jgi:hypothetical protein